MEPKFAKPSVEQVEFVQSSCAAFLDIVDELGIETDSASLDTPGICDAILEELADPIKEDKEFREHVAAVLGCALGEYLCHHLHAKWFDVTDMFGKGLSVVVTPPPGFEPRTQLAIIDSMTKRVGVEPAGFVVPFIKGLMESVQEMHEGEEIRRKR
jgi:hypothetical protein